MINQIKNPLDKVAWVVLVLGKTYMLGAILCTWVAPFMTPIMLLVWSLHWMCAVCIAIHRAIQIHTEAKQKFPLLYKNPIWICKK